MSGTIGGGGLRRGWGEGVVGDSEEGVARYRWGWREVGGSLGLDPLRHLRM